MLTRHARPDDAPALVDLENALGLGRSVSDLENDIAIDPTAFYVTEVETEIAGYLALRWRDPPACVDGQRPLQVARLYVAPAYHGKGAARSLLGRCFIHAHARKHDVLWLGLATDNMTARAFYRECGFREVGWAHLGASGARSDLIMACRLLD